jgi:hypothetical protein
MQTFREIFKDLAVRLKDVKVGEQYEVELPCGNTLTITPQESWRNGEIQGYTIESRDSLFFATTDREAFNPDSKYVRIYLNKEALPTLRALAAVLTNATKQDII